MNSAEQQRQQYLEAMGISVWMPRIDSLKTDGDTVPDSEEDQSAANIAQTRLTVLREDVPATWDALDAGIRACEKCSLCHTRTQAVPGSGSRLARLLIIGEAPGADEDKLGQPFVGASGKLLNDMLFAIGFKREDVFVTNILKCRTPNNRDPKPAEIDACHAYLQRQIELVDPVLILTLGRVAAQSLTGMKVPVAQMRGSLHQIDDLNAPVIVTYHPAHLLRSPLDKAKSWVDLQLALQVLQG